MRLIVNSRTVTERISKISHNSPLALQLQLEFECALRLRVREFESRFCCKFLSHYCAALSEAQANAGVVDAGLLLVGIRRRRRPRTGHSQRQRQRQASAAQMPSAKRQSAGAWRQQQQPQNITGRQSDRCNSTSNILGSCCPPRVPHRACSFTVFSRIHSASEFAALHIVCWVMCRHFAAKACRLSLSAGTNKALKLFSGTFECVCSQSSALINSNKPLLASWLTAFLAGRTLQSGFDCIRQWVVIIQWLTVYISQCIFQALIPVKAELKMLSKQFQYKIVYLFIKILFSYLIYFSLYFLCS